MQANRIGRYLVFFHPALELVSKHGEHGPEGLATTHSIFEELGLEAPIVLRLECNEASGRFVNGVLDAIARARSDVDDT